MMFLDENRKPLDTRDIPLTIDEQLTGIRCFVLFGDDEKPHPCVIDTGAEYTAIPESIWTRRLSPEAIDGGAKRFCKGFTGAIGCEGRRWKIQIQVVSEAKELPNLDLGECEVTLLLEEKARLNAEALLRNQEYKDYLAERAAKVLNDTLDLPDNIKALAQSLSFPPDAKKKQPQKYIAMNHILLGLKGGTLKVGGLCVSGVGGSLHACLVEILPNSIQAQTPVAS